MVVISVNPFIQIDLNYKSQSNDHKMPQPIVKLTGFQTSNLQSHDREVIVTIYDGQVVTILCDKCQQLLSS